MPVAMSVGAIFSRYLYPLSNVIPSFIFTMLFFTYLQVDLKILKLKKIHFLLIAYQLLASVGLYLIISNYNVSLAQGVMICILAPTATSAPVIVAMLHGNVENLITYSMLSNMVVVIASPIIFSFAGNDSTELHFLQAVWGSARHIVPLLFGPFLLAMLLKKVIKSEIRSAPVWSNLSFLLWSAALTIVTAKIVHFIGLQGKSEMHTLLLLATASLLITVFQFWIGRKIGKKQNSTIAFGQGLGQKNTVLAIWMAQTYLNPISSLAPGTYVVWQNIINSYQIWRKRESLG